MAGADGICAGLSREEDYEICSNDRFRKYIYQDGLHRPAGAKIVASSFGKISEEDISRMEEADAEILLFCGGHESGNTMW